MKTIDAKYQSLVSIREVASRLGVAKSTVARWIHHNGLPALHLPGGFKVEPAKLQAWIESRETQKLEVI